MREAESATESLPEGQEWWSLAGAELEAAEQRGELEPGVVWVVKGDVADAGAEGGEGQAVLAQGLVGAEVVVPRDQPQQRHLRSIAVQREGRKRARALAVRPAAGAQPAPVRACMGTHARRRHAR